MSRDRQLSRLAALLEALDTMTGTRRILLHIGYRGSALLFFFLLDLIYAYSLFNPPAEEAAHSRNLVYLASIAPLWVFGVMWLIAAGCCLVAAFIKRDFIGFAAAIGIKVLWGLLYVGATLQGVPRAYVSVTLWLTMAGFVAIMSAWPEPTNLDRLREINRGSDYATQEREEQERDVDRRWP